MFIHFKNEEKGKSNSVIWEKSHKITSVVWFLCEMSPQCREAAVARWTGPMKSDRFTQIKEL